MNHKRKIFQLTVITLMLFAHINQQRPYQRCQKECARTDRKHIMLDKLQFGLIQLFSEMHDQAGGNAQNDDQQAVRDKQRKAQVAALNNFPAECPC